MSSDPLPSTIRAIQVPKHGGVDVLTLNTIPIPVPAANEFLIKVEHAGVNYIDTYHRQGLYPATKFPFTLGAEAAGIIVTLPTDPAVLQHSEYVKRGYQVGSRVATLEGPGLLQEYVAKPWNRVSVLPESISTLTAAASAIQGLTALTFITESYNVQAGDWILVHAAAGGLGLLLTQLAKARGAHVIGTTSTEDKAKLAKEAGAEEVVVHTKAGDEGNIVKRVLAATKGEGVHAVFDGVGKDTWDMNFELIRRKGTIVSVGNASGAVPPFSPLQLGRKNIKLLRPVLFVYMVTPEEVSHYTSQLWEAVEQGTLKIRIHKQYPFTVEGVAQAHTDLTGRGTAGKLVINIV